MGVSKNRENPIKIDDLGVPPFKETPYVFIFVPLFLREIIQFDERAYFSKCNFNVDVLVNFGFSMCWSFEDLGHSFV